MAAQLTLVSHTLCPYVQRAAIALAEKGIPFERRHVDLSNGRGRIGLQEYLSGPEPARASAAWEATLLTRRAT